ncbi:MAG: ABC transporter ATP-binding protein [Clostridia bacterium]
MQERILEVKNLETSFFTHVGEVQAVRNVSFHVNRNEVLGIVGESGSGKSVTLMSIMQLITHPGRIKGGEVWFEGENLLTKSDKEMMKVRGERISMVFQDPMSSLNPVYRVGNQVAETILAHEKISRAQANERAVALLRLVGIPSPESRVNNYPHEFSGGMRQRVMIAMALACHPALLIADEPTTALDVTIQAQILELMDDIRKKEDATIILVTHDLGVVAELCDRVLVMYGGQIMEEGSARDIFYRPAHPYTQGLLKSVPAVHRKGHERLKPIPGSPPDLLAPPKGCPFSLRCEQARKMCMTQPADFYEMGEGHKCACHLYHPEVARMLREREEQK